MSIHGINHPISSPRAEGPGVVGGSSAADHEHAATAAPALSVRGLFKTYHAGIIGCSARVEALRGASLDVESGAIVGIVGPAGAGKSTFLLCVAGLLRPDCGSVAWFGRDCDAAGRPPGVAYVPERATNYGFMTVREAVEYHIVLRDGAASFRDDDTIDEALGGAGLLPVAARRISELPWSAGPQLSIAQALATRPRLVLIDGTLSGLTSSARREITGTLRGLAAGGTSMIIASDAMGVLDGLASRVAVMLEGRLSRALEPARLPSSPVLELIVAAPLGGALPGSRVAEPTPARQVVRIPLEGTTAEAVLARCRSCGIQVEGSRIVTGEPGFA